MAIAIGILLVIVTLIIVGLIFRKRIYEQVDQYETWKLDIMNRNVAGQLAKIKSLNLSGEAQEKFDSWKERWDKILTKDLPDVEELLFDAEAFADKYRFSSARNVLAEIEQELEESEQEIEAMLNELDDLLKSAEESEKEVNELQPQLKLMQRTLSDNAARYRKSEAYFKEELTSLETSLNTYFEKIDDGNYIEAREIVDALKPKMKTVEEELDAFPDLYKTCDEKLPKELANITSGMKEMKEQGYYLGHLSFEKDIERYKVRLNDCIKSLDKGISKDVEEAIEELDERIQDMYDRIEDEAVAKAFVEEQTDIYKERIATNKEQLKETKAEIERLKPSYRFDQYDLKKFTGLEQTLNKLVDEQEEVFPTLSEDEEETELD